MKDKKGFTLIELLAVIVIIILLFLFAVTAVKAILDKAEKNSVQASGELYIKEFNNLLDVTNNDESKTKLEGLYYVSSFEDIGLNIDGTKAKKGFLFAYNNRVRFGCLRFESYTVKIKDGKLDKVTERGKCQLKDGFNIDYDMIISSYSEQEDVQSIFKNGTYLVEAWGAAGGAGQYENYPGGTGAYVRGLIHLDEYDKLKINVGGKGVDVCQTASYTTTSCSGGYNGGGSAAKVYSGGQMRSYGGAGGGATSIAYESGLVKDLNLEDIILVAAGGGGGTYFQTDTTGKLGYNGAGFESDTDNQTYAANLFYTTGATQTSGGTSSFPNSVDGTYGVGGSATTVYSSYYVLGGGGGGLYGGGAGGGAGTSFINTNVLTSAAIYTNSSLIDGRVEYKTTSVKDKSDHYYAYTPSTSNGYVRITLIEED